ncbi:reticulon-like protein B11 [Hibiscus syriacus]|uniref:reticulon-like protein B11 n=1 Tax=Hibiscus syriacus TaxID=106335 RepID=UPI0019222112|nr:reticulon-like protein B11 [Hibiscus syriacus]
MANSHLTPRVSVHQVLGGGMVADVLLWRNSCSGALMLLSSSTMLWYLFERAGYNFLSFVANVLLLLLVILFLWAKSASLLNRPLPTLPDLEISEQTVGVVADELHLWINHTLAIAHDIAIGRDLKSFLKVAVGLWLVSYIGTLFKFLTLVYIGVILSLSVPVVYDKYQHFIDEKLHATHRIIQKQYMKIDESVLRKIPLPSNTE